MNFPISNKGLRAKPQPIGYLMAKGVSGECISLAAGLVDEETLPAAEVATCIQSCFDASGRLSLQYGTTEGLVGLRRKVVERICAFDGTDPESIPLELSLIHISEPTRPY